MFNGEIKKGEEAEAWLSGMKKYFQIYNYSDELKEKMAIYNLTEKRKYMVARHKESERYKTTLCNMENIQETF